MKLVGSIVECLMLGWLSAFIVGAAAGGMLAKRRGISTVAGGLLGAFLGVLGWIVVGVVSLKRNNSPHPVQKVVDEAVQVETTSPALDLDSDDFGF